MGNRAVHDLGVEIEWTELNRLLQIRNIFRRPRSMNLQIFYRYESNRHGRYSMTVVLRELTFRLTRNIPASIFQKTPMHPRPRDRYNAIVKAYRHVYRCYRFSWRMLIKHNIDYSPLVEWESTY